MLPANSPHQLMLATSMQMHRQMKFYHIYKAPITSNMLMCIPVNVQINLIDMLENVFYLCIYLISYVASCSHIVTYLIAMVQLKGSVASARADSLVIYKLTT